MKNEKKYFSKNNYKLILTDLINARVYLGSNKSLLNPSMKNLLVGIRNKICIFNLVSTISRLKKIAILIIRIHYSNGIILFAGLPIFKRHRFIKLCIEKGHFYINEEVWVNGLLTNGKEILKHKMKFLRNYKNHKKEDQLLFNEKFSGVIKMYRKPHLVIIFNHINNQEIVAEASKINIPIILFGNSNVDFKNVTYLIPGNFHSRKANKIYYKLIKYLLNLRIF